MRNSNLAKIFLAIVFFHSLVAIAGDLVKPISPTYNCGSLEVGSTAYNTCKSEYDAKYEVYRKELDAYNLAQTQQTTTSSTQSQTTTTKSKSVFSTSGSAAATLADIKQQNDAGKASYEDTASETNALGIVNTVIGAGCAASCSAAGTGCCAAAPVFFATAAHMFITSDKASNQATQHAISSAEACKSLNQISSKPTDCNSRSSSQSISYDPITGLCSPADSELCKNNPGIGPAPPLVKDALKNSGFAGIKNANDLFTRLPDGSIKFKNGMTFKESDFADEKSLMAAGLSAANAKSVLSSIGSATGRLGAIAAIDPKSAIKKDYGAGASGAGAATVVDVNKNEPGKNFSDKTTAVPQNNERSPSSEGLVKEFNGELIGVSGDDIFLMVNRRYKLKSEQDSFIPQGLK